MRASNRAVDVVLDAPASVSIYLQALLRADRRADAIAVTRAHEKASRLAAERLAQLGGWTSAQEPEMPAPHRYDATPLEVVLVLHTPPEHPGLHAHLVTETETEVIELQRAVPSVRAQFFRDLGDTLATALGLQLELSSGVPQLTGVPPHLAEELELLPCRVRSGAAQIRFVLS